MFVVDILEFAGCNACDTVQKLSTTASKAPEIPLLLWYLTTNADKYGGA
jgi:hypothetical protein